MTCHVLQKNGILELELPQGWTLQQVLFRETPPVQAPLERLLSDGLTEPIGTPPLPAVLSPGMSVAVVVDDLTRATPVRQLLPELLRAVHEKGIASDSVSIVIGTGTHKPLGPEDVRLRLGAEIAGTYRVVNHDARAHDLVVMGEAGDYGPVAFNRTVAEADFKIVLGSISPHVHNGFGGGPKNIMPGICDFRTIRRHHLKNALDPRSRVGIVEDNPFLQETVEIARLAGVDFAVQCLYDSFGRICRVLSGDVFAVHEAAVRIETRTLGIPVAERSDVTIVSSYPYAEGVQIMKAFLPAGMITRPGGSILVFSELSKPLPGFFLDSVRKVRGNGGQEAEEEILRKLARHEPLVEGAGMDFSLAMVLVFAMSRKYAMTMVGPEVLREAAEAMGYVYAPSLQAALERESARRPKASVSLIPAGGYVFPILADPFYLFGGAHTPAE